MSQNDLRLALLVMLTTVIVNGTHLAADANSFLEKRRRGLVRFANALVQHPVLGQETLVVMFLTVPTVSQPVHIAVSTWTDRLTLASGIVGLAEAGYHICTRRIYG